MSICNALTVDVEDYFHVAAFAESIKTDDWDIFSLYHDRYGIVDAPRHPCHLQTPNGSQLVEFPLPTAKRVLQDAGLLEKPAPTS